MENISTFTIEKYKEEDNDSLDKIINELIEEAKSLEWENHYTDYNNFNKYFNNKNIAFVLKEKNKPIGFIFGYEHSEDTYAVGVSFVSKKYRGADFGRLLKRHLALEANLRGYKKIISDVNVDNIVSVAMNFKEGWNAEYFEDYGMYRFTKRLDSV